MIKIFDTHAHYNDQIYDVDREELFKRMYGDGVLDITLIGASLSESKEEKAIAESNKGVDGIPKLHYTIGDHPDEIIKVEPTSSEGVNHLNALENLCMDGKQVSAVAIGEIGLDYHGDFKSEEDYRLQKKWFIAEIELAKKLNLPIVVHSRDACNDTLQTIKDNAKNYRGIIHCFSYESEIAEEYIKLGYHIGIGGTVTFKNARKVKEVVESIPIESIVTETDAPWLAPTPHRGERNESSYIRLVIEEIARLKAMEVEKASEILYQNALNVYNLG